MSDKPARTMLLTPYEWRALVSAGANTFYSFIGAMHNPVPDQSELIWFNDVLDRLKMQVSAWGASGQQLHVPDNVVMRQAGADIERGDLVVQNGSGTVVPAFPKKKRGWQKGRKRGPRTPKGEAVQ